MVCCGGQMVQEGGSFSIKFHITGQKLRQSGSFEQCIHYGIAAFESQVLPSTCHFISSVYFPLNFHKWQQLVCVSVVDLSKVNFSPIGSFGSNNIAAPTKPVTDVIFSAFVHYTFHRRPPTLWLLSVKNVHASIHVALRGQQDYMSCNWQCLLSSHGTVVIYQEGISM